MFYATLGLLFIAVFAWIVWRIIAARPAPPPAKPEAYICPHCGDYHCDCHKRGDMPRS